MYLKTFYDRNALRRMGLSIDNYEPNVKYCSIVNVQSTLVVLTHLLGNLRGMSFCCLFLLFYYSLGYILHIYVYNPILCLVDCPTH